MNLSNDDLNILTHQRRGESRDPIPSRHHPLVSRQITFALLGGRVTRAINFNDELLRVAVEIGDVRPERMLTAKFGAKLVRSEP